MGERQEMRAYSVDKVGVATVLVDGLEGGHEGLVKVEQLLVRLDEGVGRDLLLDGVELTDARVVHERAREVVVLGVVGVEHGRRDVGHVSAGVRLASHVDLVVGDAKGLFEVLEELDKVLRDLLFSGGLGRADREAGTDRLLDPTHKPETRIGTSGENLPQHVCQVGPGVRVLVRLVRSRGPDESPVLLEEALEGAATGTAVEPDGDLVDGGAGGGLEDEEEGLGGVGVVDGDQARVKLAQVKVDLGETRHEELCQSVGVRLI